MNDYDFVLHDVISEFARSINPTARIEQEGDHFNVSVTVPQCDFCSGKPVTHTIKSRDFETPGPQPWKQMSRGHWAACDRCIALVNAGDWDVIENNAVAQLGEDCRVYLRQLYRALREHMTGEIVPV